MLYGMAIANDNRLRVVIYVEHVADKRFVIHHMNARIL